jgi:hypothetical protein
MDIFQNCDRYIIDEVFVYTRMPASDAVRTCSAIWWGLPGDMFRKFRLDERTPFA